jgi:hypothetical protein
VTDENDDPVMRSMRSVWVSMRDEEPPASGLSELLAAARVKAEAMKPAPWWRRMLVVMARPPILAAATVVVLVGGGLVISQRGDHEPERADAVVSTAQPTLEDKGKAKDTPAGALERDQTATLEFVKPEPAVEEVPPQTARPRPPRRAVARPKPELAEEPKAETPPPPPPPTEGAAGGGRAVDEDRLEIAAGESVEPTATRAPELAATRRTIQRNSQPPVDQLVKQAEVAASRKDCPAVRVTVKRIQQIDKGARDRVAKQPAVANCLK